MRLYSMFAAAALFVAGTAASAPNVQEVLAEGVGKTVDDAVKDALRSAVREVVGTFVDQETRIQNDKVIDDKVLAASGGFVSKFERVGTPKEEGGLFRVKIKATVESSNVLVKLNELKITLSAVDPKRIQPKEEETRFSDEKVKAMTKEEMIANKTEIIHDALVDLPKVLEARARTPDRFDFDADSSTLKVDVTVSADNQRYVQFLKRLQLRLDKLSLSKGFATVEGVPQDLNWRGASGKVRGFAVNSVAGLSGPDLNKQPDAWCMWMLTDVLNGGKTTRWAGYTLDADVRKCVSGLHGELKVLVSILDADGATITEEVLDLKGSWLGEVVRRTKTGAEFYGGATAPILLPTTEHVAVTQKASVNVNLAPCEFYMTLGSVPVNSSAHYALSRPYHIKMKIGKEEVKRVKEIRCAVLFKPAK